jgi:flagellar hook-associated protein 3 FlgL
VTAVTTRITSRAMSNIALRGLQTSLTRAQDLQSQLSGGKRVATVSDDPSSAAAAMALRSQQAGTEQYLRNIDDAAGRLNVADDALQQISAQVQRARALVLQAGNVPTNDSARAAIAQEIGGIRDAVIGLYNTRWQDRAV